MHPAFKVNFFMFQSDNNFGRQPKDVRLFVSIKLNEAFHNHGVTIAIDCALVKQQSDLAH